MSFYILNLCQGKLEKRDKSDGGKKSLLENIPSNSIPLFYSIRRHFRNVGSHN